uniref:Uncharacterized protein n=1 Tax=Knipowitschia caucasica TaxID=637954 RepID=A0AAV2MJG4_KNICA
MAKSPPELLREAANLIEEALNRTSQPPVAAQSLQIPATPSRTPVQGNDTDPMEEGSHHASGPDIPCLTCEKAVPFSEMKVHRLSCNGTPMQDSVTDQGAGPSEENDRETASVNDSVPVRPGTSAESAVVSAVINTEDKDKEWKLIKEPAQAAKVYKESLLREHASGEPLRMKMDVRDSDEDRERELLTFYKRQQEWACPLRCTLIGDVAIGEGVMRHFMTTVISKLQRNGGTLLFEGEPDHLVPAASEVLIDSNLFRVAGRMLAHSFLHDGPNITGLSPAVIHVLFNGDPETATVVTEDCPDLHIRSIIQLLEHEELTPEQKNTVSELSMSWDLPAVTKTNRRWLHSKLLIHSVIGRTMRQIQQLRKGLKDVMLWPLLTSRPDIVPLLFPKMAEIQFTPQMLLERIIWPVEDSDEDFDIESICRRITGFLRMFIETGITPCYVLLY